MQEYKNLVRKVMDFLDEQNYSITVVNGTKSCFNDLESYLLQTTNTYSPEIATKWLDIIKLSVSKTYLGFYRTSLLKLQDVYEIGHIRTEHNPKALKSYSELTLELRIILDDYILALSRTLTLSTVANHKHMCARFLIYVQKNGVPHFSNISYDMMCHFYDEDNHCGTWGKRHVNSSVSAMMKYFYNKDVVSYGFTIILHYLFWKKECFWNDISKSAHHSIIELQDIEQIITVEELHQYQVILINLHKMNKYTKSVRSIYNRTLDTLILFLDMNGYGYTPEISMLWLHAIKHHFGTELASVYRVLALIAQYHNTSLIKLDTVFRSKPSAFELLPQWCLDGANSFMTTKIREGWTTSTLDMYRASISRFCTFIDSIGIRTYKELTFSHIKDFNCYDIHKTAAGKNAYNVRIRKFLWYLGEHDLIENPMLFAALSRTSAPKETLVVVLTETEMTEFNQALKSDDSELSLRKKTMLLLGLKMGIRSTDIVQLKANDIDWDYSTIRFTQSKTLVEVTLPMPTEVGNALYRYITQERQVKDTQNIFLSEKAPYVPIGRTACARALDTALPDRFVEGSGFHVMRKTFATTLLRKGVGIDIVSDALGQRDTTSIHRYLSLDIDRMRMCPLSQSACGIGGWHYEK